MATNNMWDSNVPVSVANGGTGATTLSAHGVLVGEGTSAIHSVTGTAGQILVSGGPSADPAFVTPTAASGLTVTTNATTLQYALDVPVSVANGGTGRTSDTAYAVVCAGTTSTGAMQSVSGLGTAGQVLTSNGAGALPTWQAAGAGGAVGMMTLIDTQVANNTSSIELQFGPVSPISSTYLNFFVTISGVSPTINNANFQLDYSSDGGTTFPWLRYNGGTIYSSYNSTTYSNNVQNSGNFSPHYTSLPISPTGGLGSSSYYSSNIWFFQPYFQPDTSSVYGGNKHLIGTFFCNGSTQGYLYGALINGNPMTTVRFRFDTGNIATGTFSFYGINY